MAREFTGESLREIAFPLGGIGTGIVSLGGRGNLRDWEIFGRPSKGLNLPYTFFAVRAASDGEAAVARVLERRLLPPFVNNQGLLPSGVPGLPRLREATFSGQYPLARVDFADETLPVRVSLEAWNPLIPGDADASGLPLAAFDWIVSNPGEKAVSVAIAFSLYNPVGFTGEETFGPFNPGRHHAALGQNLNAWRDEPGLRGVAMSSGKYADDDPRAGTLALATTWEEVSYQLRWERAGWWDDIQSFWDAFAHRGGRLASASDTDPSPEGQTDVASLALHVTLAPGAAATLPFTLAWHFPNLSNYWAWDERQKGARLGTYYTQRFADAWDAARHFAAERPALESATRAYVDAFYHSTLPDEALDAAGANVSILRSPTVLRTEDGRMNGFEGCNDTAGCCPMNCTHVWNYAQTAAFLFPELERSVRRTDFQNNTRTSGHMAFRTYLPLAEDALWGFDPAADGQFGTVMKAYREWLQSGDREFLKALWPGIRRAVEYAWRDDGPALWDPDRDGVMEGQQHNTYDIDFYGPNTMSGSCYLGGLRAAEEMARALGETAFADACRRLFESGKAKYGQLLWNGEYFRQIVNVDHWRGKFPDSSDLEPRYQYGDGCLSDQLLGQWFARVVGLGDLFDPEQVRSALRAIVRYNFRADLSRHESVQRVYALNDEAGLLLCSWPRGGRPAYPFPYADEVWTGIEYQVAAHCLYEGLLDEGLAIVRGVRDRHDGIRRNPWNEFECGHHYARALASWSLVLALSGYRFDAAQAHLSFAPKVRADDFVCFFSAAGAWGVYRQRDGRGQIALRHGSLTLRHFNGATYDPPVTVRAGETLAA